MSIDMDVSRLTTVKLTFAQSQSANNRLFATLPLHIFKKGEGDERVISSYIFEVINSEDITMFSSYLVNRGQQVHL